MVNKVKKFLKENKKARNVLTIFLIGVALVLFSGLALGGGETVKEYTLDEYKAKLEKSISELCSEVEGVGRCRVFITFERGESNVYKGSTVTEVKPPKVLGISVICDGAESDCVKRDIKEMLSSLFAVGSNRIAVLKLNS